MQQRKSVALVCPNDTHTEYVIERALSEGIARFILTVAEPVSRRLANIVKANAQWVSTIECADKEDASRKAVAAVRNGEADVLMKGTVNTDILLRAVLDKENGLLAHGHVMTHITVSHIPAYNKLLMFSDAAVLPRPSLEQFDAMLRACTDACRKLGIDKPHVALTHCTEKVNPKFEHTISYTRLIERARNGAYGNAVVDGPMDVKTALDTESGTIKGIKSPVAGNADIIIFPNIEAGNTFYKTITLLAGATTAGWLTGTMAPVVIASRADSEISKYYSLVMAASL